MGRPLDRRFSTLDAMVLVASTALGLAVLRAFAPLADWLRIFQLPIPYSSLNGLSISVLAQTLIAMLAVLGVTTTLAVLALRLRKPRPHWRRLARQPGMVACLALVGAWSVAVVFTIIHVISASVPPSPHMVPAWANPFAWLETFAVSGSILGGFAVVVAWGTMALIGRWCPKPTWLDRLGRLIGVGWVVMSALAWYLLLGRLG